MTPVAPESRAERLAALVGERGLDAMLVGDLVRPGDSSREAMADLIWLTGFAGTSGLAAVGPELRLFATDFRYAERARAGLPGGFELVEVERELVPGLAARLGGRVGFDERRTSVKVKGELEEAVAEGAELVAVSGVLERLRRSKDEAEVEAIAAAAALTDQVYAELIERGLAGRSEREIAVSIEIRMRELGADGPAFPPIVASGPNGALPHVEPGEREIGDGELVVVDIGAILDGYCSDCTRTFASGEVGEREREVYELVRSAQQRALGAIRAGVTAPAADAAGREPIEKAGYGERFGHGLGHGVGIEVHEGPRLSKRSEDELLAGDVVTVEPGVYLPSEFGVRIEDLVAVERDGCRNLSSIDKSLTVV